MIEHKHRYSDLRKFKYTPPEKFIFRGFVKDISPTKLSLDEDPCFGFVHPITSLIGKTQLPDDMALEPRDCLSLWKAMIASECPGYYVPKALDPSRALPDIPKKLDIFRWERDLKEFLKVWMADAQSPFQDVLDTLAIPLNQPRVKQQISKGEFDERDDAKPSNIDSTDLNASTFPLLCSLHEQNALPTILFNYDRSMCESLCETVLRALIDAENYWKDKSSEWKRKLQGFEDWQKSSRDKRKLEQALQEKKNKAGQKKEEGKRDAGDSKVDIGTSPLYRARYFISFGNRMLMAMFLARYNSTLESTSIYENFDPVAPLDEFSVCGRRLYGIEQEEANMSIVCQCQEVHEERTCRLCQTAPVERDKPESDRGASERGGYTPQRV